MSDLDSQPGDPSPLKQLYQMMVGYRSTQPIYVAAKLGIADLVAETPKTADELAHATKAHAPSLRRLLLMLSSVGIFAEDTAGSARRPVSSHVPWLFTMLPPPLFKASIPQ
jgi:Dimerisation domain